MISVKEHKRMIKRTHEDFDMLDSNNSENYLGDNAILIERKHIKKDGWHFDEEVTEDEGHGDWFIIIENGKITGSHGVVKGNKIIQWG